MKKTLLTSLVALLFTAPIWAEEIPAVEIDSITADTIFHNPDPEWYVAPIILDESASKAPRRAAAADCPIDSVLTFNVDSILTDVAIYEYGDTIRTITWAVNPDGSRIGKQKDEEVRSASNVLLMKASYSWDNTTNNWRGTSKEEHIYDGNRESVRILYNSWLNNAWVADTKYTWTYDVSGREAVYTTYTRNATTGILEPTKCRMREYDASGKTTLDIQYAAHDGTDWTVGTKKEWTYDGAGNIIEFFYYSGLSNGNWVNNTHEMTEYTAGKKTNYEAYTWSNGSWVGSTKELWTFNASGKQTLHEKFGWANGAWAISLQENSGYDEAGNTISVENYTITNGTWKGSKKEEYTFNSAKKKTSTITYKWTNGAWVKNVWSVTGYDAAGNTIESCKYNWKNEAWVGTGNRTLQTFNSSKKVTERITQSWSTALNDWLNKTRNTTQYSGSKTTQEASYAWSTDLNDWVGTSRSDWHYNAAGLNDTIKTYTPNGTEWFFSSRTVNTYNAEGTNIMTHNATWQENAWVMTSMTRVDIIKDAVDHQLLNASWRCYADSVWIGVSKDTAAYSPSGKNIYVARYTSWANGDWVPSYKQTFVYDEADRMLLNERYNWSSNKWQGAFRYEYGYDEQGRQNYTATYNSYNSSSNSWVGTTKTETIFNEEGRATVNTIYDWKNGGWRAFNKYLYTYDEDGHLIEQIVQSHSNSEWENALRYEKGYHNNILVISNDYAWRNGTWQITSKSEMTYDEDADAKLRREISGSWNNGVVSYFTDNLYFYDCDHPYYTIRFENYGGTLLQSTEVKESKTPVYTGETPIRPASNQYTYIFKGWTPAIAIVTGNATYTAVYDSIENQYTITFNNYDGTELQRVPGAYGVIPTYTGETPAKPATTQYTYTFKGWNPELAPVSGDASYTAEFDSTAIRYAIIYNNYDGSELKRDSLVYGATPAYTGIEPTKQATAQYVYHFIGWNPELATVTGDAVYTAEYDSTLNKYLITFVNYDGTELQSSEVLYGSMPSYPDETPAKPRSDQYTYTFKGWTPEVVTVTAAATYTAEFDSIVNKYMVSFVNYDGSEIQSSEVLYGSMPSYPDETPTKPRSDQYTYTFKGWTPEVVTVTAATTYTAEFDSTLNKYLITFVNYDGTELQSTEVAYGSMPSYPDETPTKPRSDQYTYTFKGWMPEVVTVTAATTYTAEFDSVVNEYPIVFLDEDGTKLDSMSVAYGTTPTTTVTPFKPATAEYSYTFSGWTPKIAEVTGEATYTATYTNSVNSYTISFVNYDGTVLKSSEEEYGTMPQYTGRTPNKPSNAQYTYTFNGWSPAITAVTGEATYTAQFDSVVQTYTVVFYYEDGVTELDRVTVAYGETPHTDLVPSIPGDAQYTYVFAGWSPNVEPATGDASYTATYDRILKQYEITFKNYNGQVLQSVLTDYGTIPAYTGEEPTKKGNVQYTYTFTGWTPELVAVTGEATYTAVFEEVVNTYIVIFYDEDGITELDRQEVEYGQKPVYGGETPTKAEDEEYTYTFAGWSPKITKVTGDATYRATYTATKKTNGLSPITGNPSPVTVKVMIDGHIFIRRGNHLYTLDGVLVD